MDPSLLKTNNYHEVKHWIEPGLQYSEFTFRKLNSLSTELINFGWGQYDFNEEAKLLGENKMRKN